MRHDRAVCGGGIVNGKRWEESANAKNKEGKGTVAASQEAVRVRADELLDHAEDVPKHLQREACGKVEKQFLVKISIGEQVESELPDGVEVAKVHLVSGDVETARDVDEREHPLA
eukprot:CAMPEP_0202116186 /NCGR_PEP_ID=MMETSP0965-20130614/40017_1 /ASSEMBLY_ACC=CAM_ASM_000507 /TAXON_ID=4773 /ORGANISM="Schizochytrium aggregatum, Strain ATCC28209" /LENGTH=114 /DNA_ID=CAMNT_0048686033 /DNA_START=204 /DNA_END=544 /DNA_ORIENTATION=-